MEGLNIGNKRAGNGGNFDKNLYNFGGKNAIRRGWGGAFRGWLFFSKSFEKGVHALFFFREFSI